MTRFRDSNPRSLAKRSSRHGFAGRPESPLARPDLQGTVPEILGPLSARAIREQRVASDEYNQRIRDQQRQEMAECSTVVVENREF